MTDTSSASQQPQHSSEEVVDLKPFMRIVLDDMPEDPNPVEKGSQATVVDADDVQILVDWDEQVGRSLHLIPGVDKWHIVSPSSDEEMRVSWENLGRIQDRLRGRDQENGGEDSRCPRCGRLFDLRRGAVSRRITVTNISVCDRCGAQEAIEDFVINGAACGVNVDVTVPAGRNKTGYESEPYTPGNQESGSDGFESTGSGSENEPTVSNDLDSHSDNTADDIDNNYANSANKLRAAGTAEGEKQKKEKLKIEVLPLTDWYIVRIWTGREVETSRSEQEVAG